MGAKPSPASFEDASGRTAPKIGGRILYLLARFFRLPLPTRILCYDALMTRQRSTNRPTRHERENARAGDAAGARSRGSGGNTRTPRARQRAAGDVSHGAVHATRERRGARPSNQARFAANRPFRTSRTSPRGRKPLRLLAFLGALLLVACIIGLGSSFCTSEAQRATPYASPYSWSNLQWNGDRLSYVQDGDVVSRLGIDVSDHQGTIDWDAVAQDGIDFAIIRLGNRGYTEGAIALDEAYSYNIDAAQNAGLDVGVYFFSQAITPDEAREEASFVLEHLAGRSLQMPVVFDHEPVTSTSGRANEIAGDELAACAAAFCETIEAAGYQTMVYGNRQDMERITPIDGTAEAATALAQEIGGRAVWLAEYDAAVPSATFDFEMWQYTNSGTVNGISTQVDLNIQLIAQ